MRSRAGTFAPLPGRSSFRGNRGSATPMIAGAAMIGKTEPQHPPIRPLPLPRAKGAVPRVGQNSCHPSGPCGRTGATYRPLPFHGSRFTPPSATSAGDHRSFRPGSTSHRRRTQRMPGAWSSRSGRPEPFRWRMLAVEPAGRHSQSNAGTDRQVERPERCQAGYGECMVERTSVQEVRAPQDDLRGYTSGDAAARATFPIRSARQRFRCSVPSFKGLRTSTFKSIWRTAQLMPAPRRSSMPDPCSIPFRKGYRNDQRGLRGSARSLIVRPNDMTTSNGRTPRPPNRIASHAPT